jgi:hypothetical protein
VKKYGADIVRLWVASQDYRNDIVVSEERIAKVAETYRGIRNCLRYQLSNLYDFDPAKHTVADDKLPHRLSKNQPIHRRRTFLHLPRRGERPSLHRRREFLSPSLHANCSAPNRERLVQNARASFSVHGG